MDLLRKLPLIGRFFHSPYSKSGRIYHGIESVRRSASLFYYPLRSLFRTVARTQHSEIEAIGLENIPPDGAVFLVGNHPNSLLDFFNLLTVVRHPVATAAKDTITNIPVLGYILKNYALMVPVSRAQDKGESGISEEERLKANEAMIDDAVERLVTGRLFNIYAEGRSTDSRKLNKIKLGFMMLALAAEKEFDYNLNLRIVPYGYFYDRINKFQSSVCIIFGKPFKLKDLMKDRKLDYSSLSEKERVQLEKSLMLAGKNRLQADIERLIISIPDESLVPLIDDATELFVQSSQKYMGAFENVKEKYVLSKSVAESIQAASQDSDGRKVIEKLQRLIHDYRQKLSVMRLDDETIRRQVNLEAVGHHLVSLFKGILLLPFIAYGYLANWLPRRAAGFMRYRVVDVKKGAQVDGDEQAIIAAFLVALISYPLFGVGIFYTVLHFGPEYATQAATHLSWADPVWIRENPGLFAGVVAVIMVYMMGRLWRFSVFHGRRLKAALAFFGGLLFERFRGRKVQELRELRYEIIDTMDVILAEY